MWLLQVHFEIISGNIVLGTKLWKRAGSLDQRGSIGSFQVILTPDDNGFLGSSRTIKSKHVIIGSGDFTGSHFANGIQGSTMVEFLLVYFCVHQEQIRLLYRQCWLQIILFIKQNTLINRCELKVETAKLWLRMVHGGKMLIRRTFECKLTCSNWLHNKWTETEVRAKKIKNKTIWKSVIWKIPARRNTC